MTYPKQTCAVFGCKRWSRKYPPDWEFLCGEHWQSVPKKYRRLHARLTRKVERFDTTELRARQYRVWRRCVKAATEETLMGITK